MKDFIQVGQPHSELNVSNMTAIVPIVFGVVILALIIIMGRELRKRNRTLKEEKAGLVLIVGIVGAFLLIMGTMWIVNQYRMYSHVTDYQGTFKVVQSEAGKIDTTTTDSDDKRKITLEDNKGNQQVFEVSDNQMFRKGDKAVVKVKSLGKDKQPSLDKELGQKDEGRNGFEIVSIKSVK